MKVQEVIVTFRSGDGKSEPPLRGIISGVTGTSSTGAGVLYIQESGKMPVPCNFSSIKNVEFIQDEDR